MKHAKSDCDPGNGFLVIGVYTETKAFPVCDAEVSISPSEEEDAIQNRITALTDCRGFTPTVELKVPPRNHSEISDAILKYGFFDITISKPGYLDAHVKRIPVFEGVISVKQSRIDAAEGI